MYESVSVQRLIFAVNVTSGLFEEDQSISWNFRYTNPDLFTSKPSLRFETHNGQRVGVIEINSTQNTGASVFTVMLIDDGKGDVSKGDERVSIEQIFTVHVRKRNQAPKFSLVTNVTVCSRSGEQILPGVARMISSGSPTEIHQKLTFALESVSCVFKCTDATALGKALFSKFELQLDGSLVMQTKQDYVGCLSVTVALSDDGGTGFGGMNTSSQSFLMFLMPSANNVPITKRELRVESQDVAVSRSYVLFPDGNQSSAFNFTISNIEYEDTAFSVAPYVDLSGVVHFAIAANALGTAKMSVKRSIAGLHNSSVDVAGCSPVLDEIQVSVFITNQTGSTKNPTVLGPTFDIPASYDTLEGKGNHSEVNFATISAGSHQDRVRFITSYVSSNPSLFEIEPHITSNGTLVFASATHGRAIVQVQLQVAGKATQKQFTLMVYPLPRVESVSPQIVPLEGNMIVTLRGKFLGSPYSRGYSATTYGNFSIYVGNVRCVNEAYVSDTEATCLVSSGVGSSTVTFNISDGKLSRTGSLDKGLVHAEMLYAGASRDAELSGFIGFGPTAVSSGTFSLPSASAGDAKLNITRVVLAVAKYHGNFFAGGNFQRAAGMEIGHIMEWDGLMVQRVGRGLDGVVECMTVFDHILIVGGQFMRALSSDGASLHSGGLVGWNGQSWVLIGDAGVKGIVTVCRALGSKLYIAGRFRGVGSLQAEGLAVYDGTRWTTVGTNGVSGGLVNTLAFMHGDLYVGGTFSKIGNTSAAGLAKWDGRRWSGVASFNGDVRTMAVYAESILVGGDFTLVDGVAVNNIARYFSGKWTSIGGGLDGTVLAIKPLGPCIYIGGAFTHSLTAGGQDLEPVEYLTRWCEPANGMESRFQAFETFDSIGPVHVILPYFDFTHS
jgi:hypothetical protein